MGNDLGRAAGWGVVAWGGKKGQGLALADLAAPKSREQNEPVNFSGGLGGARWRRERGGRERGLEAVDGGLYADAVGEMIFDART
jgi:hypothetical protein